MEHRSGLELSNPVVNVIHCYDRHCRYKYGSDDIFVTALVVRAARSADSYSAIDSK